jgi:hypothetical protein
MEGYNQGAAEGCQNQILISHLESSPQVALSDKPEHRQAVDDIHAELGEFSESVGHSV